VAAGVHPDVASTVAAFVSYRPEEHEPDPSASAVYDEAYARYRRTYEALRPVFALG